MAGVGDVLQEFSSGEVRTNRCGSYPSEITFATSIGDLIAM
jgi:hypothetical protein